MKPLRIAVVCVCLTLCGTLAFTIATGRPPVDRQSVWSIAVTTADSPIDLIKLSANLSPAITAADVNDANARFVADPFVVFHDDHWTMFFEVFNESTGQGDIGCATSPDGMEWSYQQIVLDEPIHLSYPTVFEHDGEFYMVPETEAADCVRLYRATSFPHAWEFERTLVTGKDLADPTVFQHNQRWYMFVGKAGTHDQLRLFQAVHLLGPWTEHPLSPLIVDDPSQSRPAGQVVDFDGKLFRLAQDCSDRYGASVQAFEITRLSEESYEERPEPLSLLTAQGHRWNSHGMHHLHAFRKPNGKWLCCVDGHRKQFVWRWNHE